MLVYSDGKCVMYDRGICKQLNGDLVNTLVFNSNFVAVAVAQSHLLSAR